MHIFIFEDGFDIPKVQRAMTDNSAVGAVASFTGLMRDVNQGQTIQQLYLDHYPAMTEAVLSEIASSASERWPVLDVAIAHRVGTAVVGDVLVYVEVRSMHRQDAFDACNYIMDVLKTRAPFWKKERTANGEHWVEPRQSDTEALNKW